MRFDRTRESMEALEARKDMTVLDVLNLFYDLCEDVKDEQGVAIEKLDSGERERMVTRLSWVGRTILKIVKSQPMEEIEEEKKARLETVCENLDDVLSEVRKTEIVIIKMQQETEKLEIEKKRLEKRKDEIREQEKEAVSLKRQCNQLEEEIRICQNNKIPDLQKKMEQLHLELEEQRKQEKQKEEEYRLLGVKKEELEQEKQDLEERQRERLTDIKKAEIEWDELKKELEDVLQEQEQIQENVKRKKEEIDSQKNRKREAEEELQVLLSWFEKEQVKEEKKRLEQCEVQIQFLKKTREYLENEWALIEAQLGEGEKEEKEIFMAQSERILNRLERGIEEYRKCYYAMIQAIHNRE